MDFFTADLHFGHKNILSFCNRPWNTVDEMNEGLILLFNGVVTPDDTTYFLGDISFASKTKTLEYVSRLHGRKVLVIGNHDTNKSVEWWGQLFDEVHDPRHGKVIPYNADFVMTHLPWRESLYEYDHREYLVCHACPRRDDVRLLHGHVHETWVQRANQINVGCDVWGYQPVSVEVLRQMPLLQDYPQRVIM